MPLDGSQVNLFIAFVGGLITFFASCLLPLVPAYLAFLSGDATTQKPDNNKSQQTRNQDSSIKNTHKLITGRVFTTGLFFTLGFITVFVLMGATVNSIGLFLARYRPLLQKLGGLMFIALGFSLLEIFKPISLLQERKIDISKNLTKWKHLNAYLIGITFGFAWTPCIGPVLAVILFWASQTATIWKGIGLLTAYGIGLGVPFLVVALLFEAITPKLHKAQKAGAFLQKISGTVILAVGILLLLGKVDTVSIKLLQFVGLTRLAV